MPSKIKLDDRNYRKHSDRNKELIKKSLAECGAGRSVLIDANDTLIAGNGVFQEAKELKIPVKVIETDGKELIAIKRTDLKTDDPKRKQLAVMDNSTSDTSHFDLDSLGRDFGVEELKAMGIEEMQAEEAVELSREITEDEIPSDVKTRCKLGQMWQLGKHRLMCGDSTDAAAVGKLMAGENAKLFFTDPPYNVNYESSDGKKIKNDNMNARAFLEFLKKAFGNANMVMKPGAAFYIFHADTVLEFRQACIEVGWQIRQNLNWVKDHFVIGRQDYQWQHEPCLYGWKDGAAHYFVDDRTLTTILKLTPKDIENLKKEDLQAILKEILGAGVAKTIIPCAKPTRSEEHPTMKPIKLIAPLIRNSSKIGWPVLDLFGGSGSTLIACEQLDRACFMMELDPKYCDVIIQRWENLTGKKAVLGK
jgi:DNA modification methylase